MVLCLLPFRVPWRQQVFVTWVGLRGAVPIVLATIPIVTGVPGSETVLDIVFVAVVAFTPTAARDATERRLRAVSRRGKLADWFGERGDAEPQR